MLSLLSVRSKLQPYDTFSDYSARAKAEIISLPRNAQELYGENLGEAVEQFTQLSVEMTKDVNPDVIHCHDWMTFEAGIRTSRHKRKPLVAHIHATELDRTDFHPNEWITARERGGLLAADKVIAVSGYTKNMLMRHYGIPGDKVAVVHNGHDREHFPVQSVLQNPLTQERNPFILFLGRLTVQKNPWQFLEMAKRVHDLRPDVRFVMAGDGPMLGTLIDRACELGLHDCMTFAGKANREEVRSLFAAASCFVMPSLSEPFGLVALEAIEHGTPVILSKQSGAAEVIQHAFTIDAWDSEKMADCVLTILREEPLARQLRSEAPHILRRLTWQNQAGNVRSIYQNLITG
ncbi:glycosyltransferase family 4 protein [Candidatus Peregrinibacteria bacterium]|nr:glycosyltransferase family 4 protein [Candidatus Peregrinibacteria bacterium]